jgi:hypothetical protein
VVVHGGKSSFPHNIFLELSSCIYVVSFNFKERAVESLNNKIIFY